MQQDKLTHALTMCKAWHSGQFRKYTKEPYWTHPVKVMELVKTVKHTEEMLCAALLHDVVEDTDCTIDLIRNPMGDDIACMVEMLTNPSKPEDGNRRTVSLCQIKYSTTTPSKFYCNATDGIEIDGSRDVGKRTLYRFRVRSRLKDFY